MKNPYVGKPSFQFWKRSFGPSFNRDLDPVSSVKFKIRSEDTIAAAGSCFAQHLSRHLKKRKFNFIQAESAHPIFNPTSFDNSGNEFFNYDGFSARYGNIYTAIQLRQLLEEAYGERKPVIQSWKRRDGRYIDPFRPQVEPGGFISERELKIDRERHLAAVRCVVEKASFFVFTLGLTEAWRDRRDGSVYPLAPGVVGGEYDECVHEFVNFSVNQTEEDMNAAISLLRNANPNIRILLTVSPVPLNATFISRHVLQSTTWSKAVLRIAAQTMTETYDFVDYFPSYEIITAPQMQGKYYCEDMRSIREEGVEHVMSSFFCNYTDFESQNDSAILAQPQEESEAQLHSTEMNRLTRVLCDEDELDKN